MGVIELVIEDIKKRCFDALAAVGASNEQCQFYSDALRCEYETMYLTYRLLAELREGVGGNPAPAVREGVGDTVLPLDVAFLGATVLRFSKNFGRWRAELDNLSSRRISIQPLNVDLTKRANSQLLTALCSLQTNEVNLLTGDELRVMDTTQPNQLKVRTARGEEGYVPALSCILPSPDNDALNAIERLQIQLLACWSDCDTKLKPLLQLAIRSTSTTLTKQWAACSSSSRRLGLGGGGGASWEVRVARRLKRISSAAAQSSPSGPSRPGGPSGPSAALDLNRLHQTFTSLENELIWQQTEQLSPMIETIANLDKVVLSYQAFRKQWRNFRQSLRDSFRPINILLHWDPKIFTDQAKSLRYYEVKLTAEETITNEETVYTTRLDAEDTATSAASHRESIAAEQLTSIKHEENRRFVVRSVVDPRSGGEVSMQEAVAAGIVDHQAAVYRNPATGEERSIASAMSEGLIRVEYATTTKSEEKVEALGLIAIKSQTDSREYSIVSVLDATTGERVAVNDARNAGLLNEVGGYYVDGRSGRHVGLDDAIEAGWICVEYHDDAPAGPPRFETKTYAVSAVVDQRERRPVPFVEAIRRGLIDRETGNYVNNVTGEKVYAGEAIRRGFFKSMVVEDPTGLDIDATNRVVVERIDKVRKNVLRGVRVIAAFSKGLAAAALKEGGDRGKMAAVAAASESK